MLFLSNMKKEKSGNILLTGKIKHKRHEIRMVDNDQESPKNIHPVDYWNI